MRFVAIAVGLSVLGACSGSNDGEASQPQANLANSQRSATAGVPARDGALGEPLSGAEAKTMMAERHEGMEEIGDAFKAASAALKKSSPELDRVRKEAETIAKLAPEVSGWFPPGTGPEAGKTHAKAEIWVKPDDFAAKTRDFQGAAADFLAASRSGDLARVKATHANLAKACKACHDPYRREKKGH